MSKKGGRVCARECARSTAAQRQILMRPQFKIHEETPFLFLPLLLSASQEAKNVQVLLHKRRSVTHVMADMLKNRSSWSELPPSVPHAFIIMWATPYHIAAFPGPSTDLECLHCGIHYCQACLHGEAGRCGTSKAGKTSNYCSETKPLLHWGPNGGERGRRAGLGLCERRQSYALIHRRLYLHSSFCCFAGAQVRWRVW